MSGQSDQPVMAGIRRSKRQCDTAALRLSAIPFQIPGATHLSSTDGLFHPFNTTTMGFLIFKMLILAFAEEEIKKHAAEAAVGDVLLHLIDFIT